MRLGAERAQKGRRGDIGHLTSVPTPGDLSLLSIIFPKNNQKLANIRQDTPTFRKIELNNLLELFGMSYHPVYHVTNMKPTSGNCPRSTSRPPLVRWLALSPDRAEPRSIAGHAFECASAHALHATESAMVAMLSVQVPARTGA